MYVAEEEEEEGQEGMRHQTGSDSVGCCVMCDNVGTCMILMM